MRVVADGRNDLIPERGKGQSVSQALDQNDFSAWDRICYGLTVFDGYERIGPALDDQRGGFYPVQFFRAAICLGKLIK